MSFEPEKFFVGIVDLFAIFLPGAVVAYGLVDLGVSATILGDFQPETIRGVMMFLFAAYVLGHFVFLVGSQLDWIYDGLRRCTDGGQIARLAEGKRLRSRFLRWLVRQPVVFPRNADEAVTTAVRIKARYLRPLAADRAINAYQWCKARLSSEHPPGFVEVQRFEAHSKFFRSFTIVLLVACFAYAIGKTVDVSLVCGGLALLAFCRYVDQRFKATQQAYWNVITHEAARGGSTEYGRGKDQLRAGGLVYKRDKANQYLFVKSEDDRWTLPMGQIEVGEGPRAAAVREVKEQTGCWATILVKEKQSRWARMFDKSPDPPLWEETLELQSGFLTAPARIFLMEIEEEKSATLGRETRWMTTKEAAADQVPQPTLQLLASADRRGS